MDILEIKDLERLAQKKVPKIKIIYIVFIERKNQSFFLTASSVAIAVLGVALWQLLGRFKLIITISLYYNVA